MNTARDLYRKTRQTLKDAGIDTADLDARLLIKAVGDISDMDLLTESDRMLTGDEVWNSNVLVERRLAGEPVSRILGCREFWGLPFKVTEDVLDPRPDTETIIETALQSFSDRPPAKILDLGTGSGCILITLLHEWCESQGVGVDISEKALAVAKENAEMNNVADRIRFVHSNWCDNIDESFDMIVSNPPYIPYSDIESLSVEVKNHDPILALDGGNDGLKSYKKIFLQIFSLLKPGGTALFEIGINQHKDVTRLVEESGLSVKRIIPDLAGIPRVVEISCGDK